MARDVVTEIRKATRSKFKAEDKIRIVLERLCGEIFVSRLCRPECISPTIYYTDSQKFVRNGAALMDEPAGTHNSIRDYFRELLNQWSKAS